MTLPISFGHHGFDRQGKESCKIAGTARRKVLRDQEESGDLPYRRHDLPDAGSRACLKNHSRHLYVPLCVIFAPYSVDVARYASFIWHKSPTNCDAHLTESIFQTRSKTGDQEKVSCFFALISGILKSFYGVVSNEERLSPERNKPAANCRIVSEQNTERSFFEEDFTTMQKIVL